MDTDAPVEVPVKRNRALAWGASSAVLVALLVGGGLVLTPLIKTPAQAAAEAEPPPASQILIEVERKVLSSDIVMRGVVQPGPNLSLDASQGILGVAPVVTDIPMSSGALLTSGSVLLEANGEPIFAMDWDFAPYRDITAGDIGPDVRQLQDTLANLGYTVSPTSVMDWQTQNALTQFYLDRGYSVPVQEEVPVPAEPSSASDVGSGSVDNAAAEAVKSGEQAQEELAAKVTAIPFLPMESIVTISEPKHILSAMKLKVGQILSVDSPTIAILDASAPTVIAALQPEAVQSLKVGDKAALTDDRNGRTYDLTVQSIGSTPEDVPAIGNGLLVKLSFTGEAADLTPDGTTLRLTTSVGQATGPLLAVPITAIYTNSDGSSFVTCADGSNVAVTVGDNVNGWVEISADPEDSISEGDQVVVGYQAGN